MFEEIHFIPQFVADEEEKRGLLFGLPDEKVYRSTLNFPRSDDLKIVEIASIIGNAAEVKWLVGDFIIIPNARVLYDIVKERVNSAR